MKSILSIFLAFLLFSFTPPTKQLVGEYGVFNKEKTTIKLTLNEDNFFILVDNRKPNFKYTTKGTWEVKGNQLELLNCDKELQIASTWKIDSNFPCLKSRKKLEFTRICNCEK